MEKIIEDLQKRSEGRKDDQGKDRWDLLPWKEMEDVVKVITKGAEKYAENNWKLVDKAPARYFAATMRHLSSWKTGNRLDPETGISHLAHAVCDILFLMYFDKGNKIG